MAAKKFASLLSKEMVGLFFLRSMLQDFTEEEHLQAIYHKALEVYDTVAGKLSGGFTPVFTFIDSSEHNDESTLRMSISKRGDVGLIQLAYVDLDVVKNPGGWGEMLVLAPHMQTQQPIAA